MFNYLSKCISILLFSSQRAYFKDIHILVPETWSNSDAYSHIDWQRYDQSDVIIDLPSDNGNNRPYTNKHTPCGEPGLFIHLTPDYILSQSQAVVYGEYDKVFFRFPQSCIVIIINNYQLKLVKQNPHRLFSLHVIISILPAS